MNKRIPGSNQQKLILLEKLSAENFPYLIADILFTVFKHSAIKVVDGPGDGRRDIISISNEGNRTITQCKFTKSDDKTVSARETDEIVLVLHKYNVSHGFFATTGNLSPQAKREYADQFKAFSLDWMDGATIVDHVLSNAILKKVWFDGDSITSIDIAIVYPLIIRNNVTRKNVDRDLIDAMLNEKEDEFTIENDAYSTTQFYPYQASLDPIISGSIFCFKFIFEGPLRIADTSNVHLKVIEKIQKKLNWVDSPSYSVKFGIPHFHDPAVANFTNAIHYNLPFVPKTYILTNKTVLSEYSWLTEVDNAWLFPTYIKMSNLSNYKLLNRKEELSLEFVYITSPIDQTHNRNLNQVRFQKMLWQSSLFLVGTAESAISFTDSLSEIDRPNNSFDYGPSHTVLAWMHPSPILFSLDISEEDDICDPKFALFKSEIENRALPYQLKQIDPNKSLAIARLNRLDPIPDNPETAYGIVSFNEEFETIPSPFVCSKRDYFVEKVWCVALLEEEMLSQNIEKFIDIFNFHKQHFNLELIVDTETNKFVYVRIGYHLSFSPFESTQAIIENQTCEVKRIFDVLQKELMSIFPRTHPCTETYLKEEFDIFY